MVIGDSLSQGCRSLTINKTFCSQSYGSRIAKIGGFNFQTPDFPRAVLFDLEEEIRNVDFGFGLLTPLVVFEGFMDRLRSNLDLWIGNQVESSFTYFDNLGLAGCLVGDLLDRTASSSDAQVKSLVPSASSDIPLSKVGDLHLAINARFTLNPSQDPAYANLSPMGWVAMRQPKRLIVHVGHNHGLYSVGGDGLDVSVTQGSFWQDFGRLATALAALPNSIEQIVIVLLPKVGATANLKPVGTNRTNGYADQYDPVFATASTSLSGEQLSKIDQSIVAANAQIIALMNTAAGATASRYRFVDTYQFLDSFDYKNYRSAGNQITTPLFTIDNDYIDGTSVPHNTMPSVARPVLTFTSTVTDGGMQSVDGMHLTGAGYCALAAKIMDVMGWQYDKNALLIKGYGEDPLLSNFPTQIPALIGLLKTFRGSQRSSGITSQNTATVFTTKTPSSLQQVMALTKASQIDPAFS